MTSAVVGAWVVLQQLVSGHILDGLCDNGLLEKLDEFVRSICEAHSVRGICLWDEVRSVPYGQGGGSGGSGPYYHPRVDQ